VKGKEKKMRWGGKRKKSYAQLQPAIEDEGSLDTPPLEENVVQREFSLKKKRRGDLICFKGKPEKERCVLVHGSIEKKGTQKYEWGGKPGVGKNEWGSQKGKMRSQKENGVRGVLSLNLHSTTKGML